MNHDDKSRDNLFINPEEVVTFAQAYYATEFPNDERRGCLRIEILREAARSGNMPGGQMRSHLFDCSECFRSFRSARMSHRTQVLPARPRLALLGAALAKIRSPWAPVAVGASCLVFLGLVAVVLWHSRNNSRNVAVNYSPQSNPPTTPPTGPTDSGAASDVKELVQGSSRPDRQALKISPSAARGAAAKNPRTRPSLPVVYVDLKEDNLLRGDDEAGSTRRVITLSPERQRLRLRMPRGSAAGRYTVKVVDAFGKPLLTTMAKSSGRTLTVELDLRVLTAKSYRLCLSRDGEAPDCYLMSVGDNPSAP